MKNNRGITLIALVVTIIILVILAAISINLILNNGLVLRTGNSAKLHGLEEEKERLELIKADVASDEKHVGIVTVEYYVQELIKQKIVTEDKITDNGDGSKTIITDRGYKATISPKGEKDVDIVVTEEKVATKPEETPVDPTPGLPDVTPSTPAGTEVKKPNTWTSEEVIAIADGKGGLVPLPSGYSYIGGNFDTGLVISDKADDTLNSSGVSMGNQFVWIPVPDEATLKRTEFDSEGQPTTGLEATYVEPCQKGYSTERSEYNTMKEQVLKYEGFFIGRFEAGVNSTTLRTQSTTAQTVVIKKGVAPYDFVPWGKSSSDITSDLTTAPWGETITPTKGAVWLAQNMYPHPESVTSTLCYGCQWDAMCRYIDDCSMKVAGVGSSPGLTGSVDLDFSKNIYDLAGNVQEWTMEANTQYTTPARSYRGGGWEACAISKRDNVNATYVNDDYGFRVTLYVK